MGIGKGLIPCKPGRSKWVNLSSEGYTNLEVYLSDLIVNGNANNKNTDNPVVAITSPVNNTLKEVGNNITVEAVASDKRRNCQSRIDC